MNGNNENVDEKLSNTNNDEKEGYNESDFYEDAKNDYLNQLAAKDSEVENTTNSSLNDDSDDMGSPVNITQKTPGSSGAYPVGAFDTSKD